MGKFILISDESGDTGPIYKRLASKNYLIEIKKSVNAIALTLPSGISPLPNFNHILLHLLFFVNVER
jgi:hypothetical protein